MILKATTVKHNRLDTRLLCTFCECLTNNLRCFALGLAFHLGGKFLVDGRGRHNGMPQIIVNHLSEDIVIAAENVQTWTFGCPVNLCTNAALTAAACLIFNFAMYISHFVPSLFLTRFTGFATDTLVRVANALAQVGFGGSPSANFRGN